MKNEKWGVIILTNGKKISGFFNFVENGVETHKTMDSFDFLFIPFSAIQYLKYSKNASEVTLNEPKKDNG